MINMSIPTAHFVRSFVRRSGRLTPSQRDAIDRLLPTLGIPAEGAIDVKALFGREAPLWIEVGFGDGDALLEAAERHPEANFLGVEVHEPGVGRALRGIDARDLGNVRVACTDAVPLLTDRIDPASAARFVLLFPDPWPKKRHHKRRIVQRPFVRLVAGILRVGGVFHTATDWAPYAEHMLEVLSAEPSFRNCHGEGNYAPAPGEQRLETKFERRGLRLGHGVFELEFERTDLETGL